MSYGRVMFFCGNITHSGGTERALANLANALVMRGFTVNIASLCGSGESFFPLSDKIRVDILGSKTLKSDILSNLRKLKKICDEVRPDIWIDVDSILIFYSELFHRRLKATKFISWEHFKFDMKFEINPGLRRLTRRKLVKSDNTVVVLTEYDRKKFEEIPKRKCRVECICNSVKTTGAESDYSNKTALAAGHLVKGKGYDTLLEIWKKIEDSGCDFKLKICGDGSEGKKLKAKCTELGLENVALPGRFSDMEAVYASASIFLMTSEQEGLPMVMLEALAAGLPVISFDYGGGIREIIDDGKNGFIVPKRDADEYARKLILLTKDEELRRKMGAVAKKSAEKYSTEKIADDWEKLFSRL